MARKKLKSGDISGYRYVVTQLGAIDGKRIADEFMRVLLPVLTELLSGLPAVEISSVQQLVDKMLDYVRPERVRGAIDIILKALPQSRVEEIIEQMAKHTDVLGPGFGDAGAPLWRNFDEHFAGTYKAMFQWLAFAIKVNFADFFDDAVGEVVDQIKASQP